VVSNQLAVHHVADRIDDVLSERLLFYLETTGQAANYEAWEKEQQRVAPTRRGL